MEYSYIGLAGTLIGVISFSWAFYQSSQKNKLRTFCRSQAWYLYKKANRLLITIRNAKKLYHENNKNNAESEIVSQLAKCQAFGLEILDETIRHVQLFEPNFNKKINQKWADEILNILNEDKELFEIKEEKFLFEKLAKDKVRAKPNINDSPQE